MELPEDRYAEVQDHRVRYWHAGSGPPVVLLHGLGNSVLNWRLVFDGLARKFAVYALDLPGHGLSDLPKVRFGLPEAARFMVAFADRLGLGSMHVVGNSMGGAVALETGLLHPERVASATLVGSAGLGREIKMLSLRLATLPLLGEYFHIPTKGRVRALVRTMLYDPRHINEDEIELRYRYAKRKGLWKVTLQLLRHGVSLRGQRDAVCRLDRVGGFEPPLLLLWGREDPLIPVAHAEAVLERVSGAKLHVFERAGHWPHVEHPEEFTRIVIDFLTDAGQTQPGGASAPAAPQAEAGGP